MPGRFPPPNHPGPGPRGDGMTEQERYDLFVRVIADAIKPAMDKLTSLESQVQRLNDLSASKDDLRGLRDDFAEFRRATYNREMVDAKIADLKDEVKAVEKSVEAAKEETREARKQAGTDAEKTVTRIGLIASVGYMLLQALPHLVKAFGP